MATDFLYLPPSIDPGQRKTVMGTIQFIIDKLVKQDMDNMLPAKVIAYDRTRNRASVQIMVTMVNTLNQNVLRAQVASVPVLQLGGGGFVLSFPISPGDLGWIKTTDVDMSLFLQQLNISPPNTQITHKFDSSMFIPDTMLKGVSIASEDVNNAVLQNLNGTVKVSWWSNLLKITAPRVGIGGTPNANAILDVQSTTKAFMPPRMTTTQRDAIPSPTEGMMIWNLTTHGISTYNGTSWS